MEDKLKIGISPILLIMRLLILFVIIGFCATTVLGVVDFRTEEEIQEDYRESIVNHSLFDEAKMCGKEVLDSRDNILNEDTVTRISCLQVNLSGEMKKVLLIETVNTEISFCYATYLRDSYVLVASDVYRNYKKFGRVVAELVLEGEDLEILYEEVINNGSDTMQ